MDLWISSSAFSSLPPMAVIGGYDVDQAPIYVGRSFFEGDCLPAKVIPSKRIAYVCWGGQEISRTEYEVLTGQGYAWVPCAGGTIPPNAVKGGNTRSGEPLLIGRAQHQGSLCVGKIHHGCLYIPFGGQEVRINNYEVLILAGPQHRWWPTTAAYTPPDAVVAGHDLDRTVLYVGRAQHEGEMLPAKVVPSKGCAYICSKGYEIPKINYEILTGIGYYWEKGHHHTIPPNAVSTGFSNSGEPLLVGRGHHMLSHLPGLININQRALFVPFDGKEIHLDSYEYLWLNWVHSSARATIPPRAVIGGNDVNGDVIYVGRVSHCDNLLPIKIIPSKLKAYTSWCGEEITKEHFEVLCSDKCKWKQCYNHVIPENAVTCGNTSLGQPVYIGRGHYEGSLTIGRVSSVHRALFIPFNGAERRLESYEILVLENNKNNSGWKFEEKSTFPMPMPNPPSSYPKVPVPSAPPADYNFQPVRPPPSYMTPMPIYPPIVPPQLRAPAIRPADIYRPPTPVQQGYSQHTWISCAGNRVPQNAVIAGHDIDMSTLYVCRVLDEGIHKPGKFSSMHGQAYVCSHGKEIVKGSCEILINNDKYHWVPMADNKLPPGVVCAGYSHKGKPLFVGRGNHMASLTPGYIKLAKNFKLIISFGGRKQKLHRFEALVLSSEFYQGKYYT